MLNIRAPEIANIANLFYNFLAYMLDCKLYSNGRLRGVQIDEVLATEHLLFVGECHCLSQRRIEG
jgi:hypothetical protein